MAPSGPVIITALDYPDAASALELAGKLNPDQTNLKVGKELFTRSGPMLLDQLHGLGFRVFLDLKFHDIPNTVAGALRAAVDAGVWMVNVHASGGQRMLEAAREAVPSGGSTMLIAVTVLTSLNDEDLGQLGIAGSVEDQVLRLASLSAQCELDGVVCSPMESSSLKARFGANFRLVTPGVRPAESENSDQRRVMTPEAALKAGSDYLVIGRPITQSDNPEAALEGIHQTLQGVRR